MRLTVRSRTLVVFGLVTLLFGLAVWYGTLTPAPALGDYPSEDEVATDYTRYLGAYVTVGGRVVTTDPVVIHTGDDAGNTIRLTVTDLTATPTVGDHLRVFGVVKDERTIRANSAFTIPQWGLWYTWGVSFVAGLWVLARLIRHWRLNLTDGTLTPREIPIASRLGARIRAHFHKRGD